MSRSQASHGGAKETERDGVKCGEETEAKSRRETDGH